MNYITKLTGIAIILFLMFHVISCTKTPTPPNDTTGNQIIADHTIVADYDKIPQNYIDEVKKMFLSVLGESHSYGYQDGLTLLEDADAKFAMSATRSPDPPESYTGTHLRISNIAWGDYTHSTGWQYSYGEEDWWTNGTAIERTKAGITYCNTHSLTISAIGFGWCYDPYGNGSSPGTDPVYGCHWAGWSEGSPTGNNWWGLDEEDNAQTGNAICLDTYLEVTQAYIDYCTANSYPTKVFFTTGPVDAGNGLHPPEQFYQAWLKYERIRNYVKADETRILFDYADILCYDDDGTAGTETWNGHTFPAITAKNAVVETSHISNAGALRLGKAMWWMLARIAGWDGN